MQPWNRARDCSLHLQGTQAWSAWPQASPWPGGSTLGLPPAPAKAPPSRSHEPPSPRQRATQQEPMPSSTRQRASRLPEPLVLTSVKKKINESKRRVESVRMSSEFLTFARVLISSYCLWVKKCAPCGSRSNSREPPLVRWRAVPLRLQSRSKKNRRSQ